MITAESITDDEVRSVWTDFHNAITGRELMAALREPLWDGHVWPDEEVAEARTRCAQLLAARKAAR